MSFVQLIGALLVLSDIKDVGKFDRIHHWHLGAALLLFGQWKK